MATQLRAVPTVIHIGDALMAISQVQAALKNALTDAETVRIELTDTGLFRAVMTLKALSDPKETLFVLNRGLVSGYAFHSVSQTVGDHKRHVIAAEIVVN